MKVNVNWGSKNENAKFRVQGADLESAGKFLQARGEWGSFSGHFPYKWKATAQGQVSSVVISPTYTIQMPTWAAYRKQSESCKNEWDEMWRALRKHEAGHRDIFLRGISKLVGDLEAIESTTGPEIDDLMERAGAAVQKEHDDYDSRTDHGKSRGVELSISEECRTQPKGSRSK